MAPVNSALTAHDWVGLVGVVFALLSASVGILLKITSYWAKKQEMEMEKLKFHLLELEKSRFVCENMHQTTLRDIEKEMRREFVHKEDFKRMEDKIDALVERIQAMWERISGIAKS